MDEEYNPFQSPVAPPTPSDLLPQSLYLGRRVVPFASGHMRAMFAMALLGTVAIADLLGCWACVSQNNLLDAIMRGQRPAQSVLEANDRLFKSIAFGSMLANVATIVAFLMWTHRVYRNLPALGAPKLESTPGMAVGWYFVPFANLVVPCKLMAEVWRYSDPGQYAQLRKTTSPLIGIWWAAFLIRGIVSEFNALNAKGGPGQSALETLKSVTTTSLLAFTLEIVAALLAILVVFWIDKNQQATHDLITAREQGSPTMEAGTPYGL
jgi:hypothetical protein